MKLNELYTRAIDVTPDNTALLEDADEAPVISRGIKVAVAGDVTIINEDDQTSKFTLAAGILYPIRAKIVKSTGTTATGIQVWY